MNDLYDYLFKELKLLEQTQLYAVVNRIDIHKINDRNIRKMSADCEISELSGRIIEAANKFRDKWNDELRALSQTERKILTTINEGIITAPDLNSIETDSLIHWSQLLALILIGDGLKSSQLRKFFGNLRRIEVNVKRSDAKDFNKKEISFLKVHLAYATARQSAVKPLMKILQTVIDKIRPTGVDGIADFNILVRFCEGIVAYHKFYGGND